MGNTSSKYRPTLQELKKQVHKIVDYLELPGT